ncbi:MAG TPA: TRAP transporter small permease [Acidobacteriota bacterium]|nr:TRAP transporter small permease [Acidobacteriota bacterium]
MLELIDRWSGRASLWLYRLGVYGGLPALVVLVTIDVLLRYLFNAPLRWSRDANGLLLLISLFGALPHAWDRGFHIRMELVHSRLRGRRRQVADLLSALSGIVVFGALTVQSARFVPYMAATWETGEDLMLPLWPFMGFMGICSLVFVGRLLSNPEGEPAAGEAESEWM